MAPSTWRSCIAIALLASTAISTPTLIPRQDVVINDQPRAYCVFYNDKGERHPTIGFNHWPIVDPNHEGLNPEAFFIDIIWECNGMTVEWGDANKTGNLQKNVIIDNESYQYQWDWGNQRPLDDPNGGENGKGCIGRYMEDFYHAPPGDPRNRCG